MDKVIKFVCTMPAIDKMTIGFGKMAIGFEQSSPTVLIVFAQVDGTRFYEPGGQTPEEHAKALEKVTARIAEKLSAPAKKIEVKVEGGKF